MRNDESKGRYFISASASGLEGKRSRSFSGKVKKELSSRCSNVALQPKKLFEHRDFVRLYIRRSVHHLVAT